MQTTGNEIRTSHNNNNINHDRRWLIIGRWILGGWIASIALPFLCILLALCSPSPLPATSPQGIFRDLDTTMGAWGAECVGLGWNLRAVHHQTYGAIRQRNCSDFDSWHRCRDLQAIHGAVDEALASSRSLAGSLRVHIDAMAHLAANPALSLSEGPLGWHAAALSRFMVFYTTSSEWPHVLLLRPIFLMHWYVLREGYAVGYLLGFWKPHGIVVSEDDLDILERELASFGNTLVEGISAVAEKLATAHSHGIRSCLEDGCEGVEEFKMMCQLLVGEDRRLRSLHPFPLTLSGREGRYEGDELWNIAGSRKSLLVAQSHLNQTTTTNNNIAGTATFPLATRFPSHSLRIIHFLARLLSSVYPTGKPSTIIISNHREDSLRSRLMILQSLVGVDGVQVGSWASKVRTCGWGFAQLYHHSGVVEEEDGRSTLGVCVG